MDRAGLVGLLRADPASTCLITDFDGTLAAVVPDPEAARPLPGAAELLAALSRRYGRVAVVSGRPAAFLAEHLRAAASGGLGGGPSALRLVGLYGLESVTPAGQVAAVPEAEPWRAVVTEAADRAEASAPAGARVERKGLAVTLHWREVPEHESWATAEAGRLGAELGLIAHPAKMSCELRPPLETDKGKVVAELAAGFATVAFLGDDLGDLPAFEALDALVGAGVRTAKVAVTSPEAPPELLASADLVLDGPEEALRLLEELAQSDSPTAAS